jgi:hypothetical protein
LDLERLSQLLRTAQGKLSPKDYALLKAIADSYSYIVELAGDETMTMARLRELLGYPPGDSEETDSDEQTDPELPDEGSNRSGPQR